MSEQSRRRCILVGVNHGQAEVVLQQALQFARALDAALVCAHVDVGRYVVEERADGTVVSRPLDPDLPELADTDFDPSLAEHIRSLVGDTEVSFRELAGDRAYALSRLSEICGVDAIVVGSRRRGVRSGLKEFFGGSVAAQLAHRQHRPVIVVPVAPVPAGGPLPWEPPGPG
ncbi:universal stress protein [uncultured Friedmanniella sp.]|uniref:universal stress protein n=1 Tax=uncultured Friedmanniella sp. TaxID=335381 RepID=UPI0035CA5507